MLLPDPGPRNRHHMTRDQTPPQTRKCLDSNMVKGNRLRESRWGQVNCGRHPSDISEGKTLLSGSQGRTILASLQNHVDGWLRDTAVCSRLTSIIRFPFITF